MGAVRTAFFLFISLPAFAQQVALTFDDLPIHGPLPEGMTRSFIARSITKALVDGKAPKVYGMINAKGVADDPADAEFYRIWTEAGFPLGNHTFSHLDLHRAGIAEFQKEIEANEPYLQKWMGSGDWHWFRYPFLNEGHAPEKYHEIRTFLAAKGYRIAQVTISFADYLFNEPYVRCVAQKNTAGIEDLKAAYLEAAEQSLADSQARARLIWGRDIRHIMLLHVGAFETVMLPRLLELLDRKGFRLIPLNEAAADPVYQLEPWPLQAWSGTFLDQMMAARQIKRPADPSAPNPLARLNGICRVQ